MNNQPIGLCITRTLRPDDVVYVRQYSLAGAPTLISQALVVVEVFLYEEDKPVHRQNYAFLCVDDPKIHFRSDIARVVMQLTKEEHEFALANPFNTARKKK